ncbi:hypothetical protein D3C86_2188700 [compost metagenome]
MVGEESGFVHAETAGAEIGDHAGIHVSRHRDGISTLIAAVHYQLHAVSADGRKSVTGFWGG